MIPIVVKALRSESTKATNKWENLSDNYKKVSWKKTDVNDSCPVIKIKLEKPGIYQDTTPSVELTMDIRALSNSPYFDLWKGYKDLKVPERPFKDTMKDWIAENYPHDVEDGDSGLVDLQRKMEAFQTGLANSRQITEEINARPSSSGETSGQVVGEGQ